MADELRYQIVLTEDQAIVLYRYLWNLEEDGKLNPQTPTFDQAVHRALEVVYEALEDQLVQLWQDDRAAFSRRLDRASDELRKEFREFWSQRLVRPPEEPRERG